MSEPFLGMIATFGFTFAPRGWALCDGQLLSISQNTALFSLLGTTYGGNGVTTFALPNLRGRVPLHRDNTSFVQGQVGGTMNETLTVEQLPSHRHSIKTNASPGTSTSPGGHYIATGPDQNFATNHDNTSLNYLSLNTVGTGQSHNNMPPYLTLNFCIALEGIFPSRN